MRIDRSHFPWLLFVALATGASWLLFVANFHPQQLPFPITLPPFFGEVPPTRRTFGGTPLGLVFGSIAFLIFLFASALGIRKKKRLWPIGNVRLWLKAHIWLTILTIPLVLFHCGFRVGGQHATWLMVLYAIVMVSGFVGLALQHVMPAIMKDQLPREVVFEQIPHLRAQLFASAAGFREILRERERSSHAEARAGGAVVVDDPSIRALADFLDDECLPYLSGKRGERLRLGDRRSAEAVFGMMKCGVADEWQGKVAALERWCEERRWMDVQTRYHHALHGWLLVHVPTSFALLVFTVWHAWASLRFLVIQP